MELVPNKPHKGCMHRLLLFLGWVFVGLLGIVVVVTVVQFSQKGPVTKTSAPIVAGPAPTATPDWMAPPFDEVCGSNSKLTEIQQEARVQAIEGKRIINWTGKVYDVSKDGVLYKVEIDAKDGVFNARQLVLEGLSKNAEGLNVGQPVVYSGTIESIDIMFGVICNPMTVVSATIRPK